MNLKYKEENKEDKYSTYSMKDGNSRMSNKSDLLNAPTIDSREVITNNSSASAIISYLNEKIKYLEAENSELRKEISFGYNEKEKINLYAILTRNRLSN